MKNLKLKTSCSYSFTEADFAFVIELCKVGHVNLLSSQVSLYSDKNGLAFKEYGEKGCEGLVLPENWNIEHIASLGDGRVSVTFGVKKVDK